MAINSLYEIIQFVVHDGQLKIQDHGGFQSRNSSTQRLLRDAFAHLKSSIGNMETKNIYTGDTADSRCQFSYSKARGEKSILIPDFIFDAWPEVGIMSYEDVVNMIIEAGEKSAKYPIAFWAGSVDSHPVRKKMYDMSLANQSLMKMHAVTWPRPSLFRRFWRRSSAIMPIPKFCDYKYLIDIRGTGYSGRLKLLLFSRRCVLMVERPHNEYYREQLRAYEHFVPVKEDLSDLVDRLIWVRENGRTCDRIADNAFNFAVKNLQKEHAVKKFAQSLQESIQQCAQ